MIAEPPLQVLPSLALALGLNEAMFIQQVQYWCRSSTHEHNGRVWAYNTVEQWQTQFPFWGRATIFRIIKSLQEQNVLVTTDVYNQDRNDRTLWYAIDYDALDALMGIADSQRRDDQIDNVDISPAQSPRYQSDNVLKEQETTQEITQENLPPLCCASVSATQSVRRGSGDCNKRRCYRTPQRDAVSK